MLYTEELIVRFTIYINSIRNKHNKQHPTTILTSFTLIPFAFDYILFILLLLLLLLAS